MSSSAGKVLLMPKGEYNSATTYYIYNVVYYETNNAKGLYVAKQTTTGVAPTDTTNWQILIDLTDYISTLDIATQQELGVIKTDGMTNEVSVTGVLKALGVGIVCTINPNGTEYGANWLKFGNTVITPDTRQMYRVNVEGKEFLFFWNGTQYIQLSGGGHTVTTVVSGSILPMAGRANLQFENVKVVDDPTNDATVIKPQFHVCATEAEWNQMTDAEKNDPLIYWVRPWANSDAFATDRTPVGTVVSVAGTYNSSLHKFPTDDYLVCNGASPVYINQYPKLAEYFERAYGTKFYFNVGQLDPQDGTFALPDWSADFPENGILCIKAQISSTAITYAEIDQSGSYAGEDKVPSCARVAEIEDAITASYTTLYPYTTGGKFTFTKRNNVVEIQGTTLSNSCPVKQSVTLFTVGTEFRPKKDRQWTYVDYNNGIRVSASLGHNGVFSIYVYSDSPNVLRLTESKMYMI